MTWLKLFLAALGLYALLLVLLALNQRKLLYFPTHEPPGPLSLAPWSDDGVALGYAREVPSPRRALLFLHGNGGQASERGYVLPHLAENDALYVAEYPGFGDMPGKLGREGIDDAARRAYRALCKRFGVEKVVVVGESLGTGPASMLASEPEPPRHLILLVPFDRLSSVAQESFPLVPVRLLLRDDWDNVAALKSFTGKLEIYGADDDNVIPIAHARNLAAQLPQAQFHLIETGHGWAKSQLVHLK